MRDQRNQTGETQSLDAARIAIERVVAAVEADDFVGFCIACGAEHYGVEPDARNYPCEECGKHRVYGAEDLLLRLA